MLRAEDLPNLGNLERIENVRQPRREADRRIECREADEQSAVQANRGASVAAAEVQDPAGFCSRRHHATSCRDAAVQLPDHLGTIWSTRARKKLRRSGPRSGDSPPWDLQGCRGRSCPRPESTVRFWRPAAMHRSPWCRGPARSRSRRSGAWSRTGTRTPGAWRLRHQPNLRADDDVLDVGRTVARHREQVRQGRRIAMLDREVIERPTVDLKFGDRADANADASVGTRQRLPSRPDAGYCWSEAKSMPASSSTLPAPMGSGSSVTSGRC